MEHETGLCQSDLINQGWSCRIAYVSHPFHPWAGQEFVLITYRQNWGEDRVYFHDKHEKLVSIPAQWTSLFPEDPWVSMSTNKSYFRVPDLLELIQLIKDVFGTSNTSSCIKNDKSDM